MSSTNKPASVRRIEIAVEYAEIAYGLEYTDMVLAPALGLEGKDSVCLSLGTKALTSFEIR